MQVPAYLSTYLVHVDRKLLEQGDSMSMKLLEVVGVHEAKVVREESVAYLKVDKKTLDVNSLHRLCGVK
jgi:hypothetical protein